MDYTCSICGKTHDELPDIGADKPDHYWGVPEQERDKRVVLTSDTCVIDDESFFIRSVIEIPIHDSPERFGFGVWVSQKKENFITYQNNFSSDQIGPFFGWLCTNIRYYQEQTSSLKTRVHFKGDNLRPYIELEPTEHPLAVDQRNGISLKRAWEIVHFYQKS
jgi:hypothetical protein